MGRYDSGGKYDYLSSTEKLLQFQDLYFEKELVKKDIQQIKKITKSLNNLKIEKLKFVND